MLTCYSCTCESAEILGDLEVVSECSQKGLFACMYSTYASSSILEVQHDGTMKTEAAPSTVLRAAPTVPPPASMVFASAKSERKVSGIAKARRLRSHNIPLPSELKASGSEEAPFCCLSLAAKQLCPCLEGTKRPDAITAR